MPGDIAEAETAERVVEQALDRFGRIDTLINNAGIFIGKPFTDYTLDEYAAVTAVNLTGFFHITQRAIRQMLAQGGGHVVNVSTSLVDHAEERGACRSGVADQGRPGRRDALARHRVRLARYPGQRGLSRSDQDAACTTPPPTTARPPFTLSGGWARSSDVVDGILYLERATFVTGETLHIDGGQAAGH